MKKILSLFLAIITIMSSAAYFSSCSSKDSLNKLIFLQENALTSSEYDAKKEQFAHYDEQYQWAVKHNTEIKKAIIDIGLSVKEPKKKNHSLSKEDVYEFINMYSVEELFDLFSKIDRYVDEVDLSPLMWCVESCPDKFINILELEENIDGYYKENPNAYPISREEPLSDNENYVEKYAVKYYGDFAIAEEERYRYSKGYLGWKNGVFIDEPDGYYVCYYTSVYYKGENKGDIYYRCPKYKEEASMMNFNIYAYVREDTGELYFLFTDNEGKTNKKTKLFSYEYR